MANKILVARGTKSKIESVKSTLHTNELVYSTDTSELGIKKANGEIEYFKNATDTQSALNLKADKSELFSKNYNDLTNKPALKTVATTGDYNDLTNKPTIPSIPSVMSTSEGNTGTATTQRTINAANLKSIILYHSPAGARPASDVSSWAKAATKPTYTAAEVGARPAGNVPWSEVSGKPSFATVATSGSYNDLTNKPSIPSIPSVMSTSEGTTGTATTQRTINAANLKDIILHHSPAGARPSTWADVSGKPSWIGSSKPSYNLGEIAETTTYKRVTQSEKDTWNGKQSAITGAATTITSNNLTTNRVLTSDGSGKVTASSITSTELGSLYGVTSNIQTQLDNKLNTSGGTLTGTLTSNGSIIMPFRGLSGTDRVYLELQGVSANDTTNENSGAFIRFRTSISDNYGVDIGAHRRTGGKSALIIKTGDLNPTESVRVDENKNLIVQGNITSSGQAVVLNNDSRLTNARPASSVNLATISVDTINGKTKGNAILRQDASSGNVVIGSDAQKLRLTGNETRPKYATTNPMSDGTNYKELALLSDVNNKVDKTYLEYGEAGSLNIGTSPGIIINIGNPDVMLTNIYNPRATYPASPILADDNILNYKQTRDYVLDNKVSSVGRTLSTSTTLALTDKNTLIRTTNTSSTTITLTVPTNASVAYPDGTEIHIFRKGAGEVTISPASGVSLLSEGSKRRINAQYQMVTIKKLATNEWILVGALKS